MQKTSECIGVAAISNKLEISNVDFNIKEIINCINDAKNNNINMLCFPELSLCGNTCYDLFFTADLLDSVLNGLKYLKKYSESEDILFIVGAPLKINGYLYNCSISINKGEIIGITPKIHLSTDRETLGYRYFKSGKDIMNNKISLFGDEIKISDKFACQFDNNLVEYCIHIGEDLYFADLSIDNSKIIFHPTCDVNLVGVKDDTKESLIEMSKKYNKIVVHANASSCESSSYVTYDGYVAISEMDGVIVENRKTTFDSKVINKKVKCDVLEKACESKINVVGDEKYDSSFLKNKQKINYSKTPFVLTDDNLLEEVLEIQTLSLARRIKQLNGAKMILGISGGSDSTLAFLVCLRVKKLLNMKDEDIIGVTMPGFGTSKRTYNNSLKLVRSSGAILKEIPIVDACIQHYKDIGHDINDYDITYENAQARERTQILFDLANDLNGIVVGTGDLSEMVLGWATYNGDQMSNYGVNIGIPKTLVLSLIEKVMNESDGELKTVLKDILNTPISPELLPLDKEGNIVQDSQKSVGPYKLHDFFIYHFLGYGLSLKNLYSLACDIFEKEYEKEHIKATLTIFIKRLFTQQFKRSTLPDGVKVFDIGLNAKVDLILPSDASCIMYLKELEEL